MKKQELLKMLLEANVDCVEIVDSSSPNGGGYGFWRRFSPVGSGRYEVTYHTTADFPYCPARGLFLDSPQCSLSDEECEASVEITTADKLAVELAEAEELNLRETSRGVLLEGGFLSPPREE